MGSFSHPIYVTSDPADPDRLLVVEREGVVLESGPSGERQLADLRSLVSCCESECGLLSIAPAPDFHASGRFYAAYTGNTGAGGAEGDIHLDSFLPDPGVPGQVLREPLLTIGHAENANHNGGQLQFGPDGYLYLSTGDGGGSGDPAGNAQDAESLLGKLLRIEPRPGQVPPYASPSGNPFALSAGRDEVWAYGLRNPWRFSFDRASGDMVIGDVGQGAREEVDFAPSVAGTPSNGGANYGWNCREGFIAYSEAPGGCTGKGGFTEPVFDYPHEDPGGGAAHGCSIIGGYVVRDKSVPDLYGRYLYTDYCTGEVRSLQLPSGGGIASGDRSEGLAVEEPISFGEDSCGRIYLASNKGTVYRIEGPIPAVCSRAAAPAPASVPVALSIPGAGARTPRLTLRAVARRHRLLLLARVQPCAGHSGARVQLNRGGRRLAAKRVDRHCRARFQLRMRGRATFRALLRGEPGVRSRRLRIALPRRGGAFQRSQARTIALAKPIP